MKLSVIILTKNEGSRIQQCIASVQFADEIIVVDAKSSDDTATRARALGARVFVHPQEDFAKQREFAAKQARSTWILYVDADEQVSPSLAQAVEQVLAAPKDCVYKIARHNYFLGNNLWPSIEYPERLFKKKNLRGWKGQLHESAMVSGTIGVINEPLIHHTHRDLTSMVAKTNEWSEIESTVLVSSGHPPMRPWRFLRIMATKFLDSYITKRGFNVGTIGLIESIYQAYSYFIIYAKLWEKQEKSKH